MNAMEWLHTRAREYLHQARDSNIYMKRNAKR